MVYNSAIYPTQASAAYNVFAGSGPLDQEAWSDVHLKGVIGYHDNRTTQSFEKDKNSDWGYSLQGPLSCLTERNPERVTQYRVP